MKDRIHENSTLEEKQKMYLTLESILNMEKRRILKFSAFFRFISTKTYDKIVLDKKIVAY